MTEQSSTRQNSAAQDQTANPFDPSQWREIEGFANGVDLTDLTYHRHVGEGRVNGIVRIAFDRPDVRNAFRPHTVDELYRVFDHARRSPDVGTILFTG
ncbi:1,4-dihydroxy-2-naphthoyl-CoA synthase, partial [Acinetobacter baumannii]|nr:1,4-dihydroxy-2-naphthoyl-CoA synthase [Acinetobacter baumannii]